MIDSPDSYVSAAYVAGGGLMAVIAQQAWSRFFTKEGKANDLLTQQLTERIAAQESRIISVETGLDSEREARRRAEDRVHALEMDNLMLRAELRRHNIDVPPSMVTIRAAP